MSDVLNKCVWMWAGLLTYRLCDREYQCSGCPVEALFHPEGAVASPTAPSVPRPSGSFLGQRVPAGGDRFHDSQHLWLRVLPAGEVQIGFDPIAASLLRPVRSFELPEPGSSLQIGQVAVRAHFEGGTVDFASPVAGDVLRVHQPTPKRLASMLRSPYTRAWMLVLSVPRLERQLARLSFGHTAGLRMAQEWSKFQEECLGLAAGSPAGQPVLPDGGELDLDRLAGWVGTGYPALVRRWIGVDRVRTGRSLTRASRRERGSQGGAEAPPKER
jgi:glycine cleavage system H lipoate-binding protein